MEPEKFGRTLGIGVRVASNIARDRAARAAGEKSRPAAASQPLAPSLSQEAIADAAGRTVKRTRAVSHGAKKFGEAFLGPLRHAGSVLWLEITGLFFALFAVFFLQGVYRVHAAWRQGPEHSHFVLFVILGIVFMWFSVSSFLRARSKQKRRAYRR